MTILAGAETLTPTSRYGKFIIFILSGVPRATFSFNLVSNSNIKDLKWIRSLGSAEKVIDFHNNNITAPIIQNLCWLMK